MKKLMVFGLNLIVFLFVVSLVSAVRINEVMANPSDDCNDCTEWIEIHTDSPSNIINWTLDTTDQKTNFSFYIEDFLIITGNKTSFLINWNVNENKILEWKGIGLVNSGNNISLYNGSGLISSTEYPSLPENKTYSLLSNSSWIICDKPTPGSANSCEPQTPDNNNQPDNETEIYLKASWDEDEIKNGEEFDIEVKAYNLKDESYNLKIWIEFEDNNTIISDRYDEENDEWKSGTYYVDEFFNGPGNKSKEISLRIRNSYKNFKGDSVLKAKLENEEHLLEEEITILEKEDENNTQDDTEDKNEEKNITKKTTTQPTESVIRLGNRSKLQEQNNTKEESKVLYESPSEKIKKYTVYALNVILIVIIILLIRKKV